MLRRFFAVAAPALMLAFIACAKGEAVGGENQPCDAGNCDDGFVCIRDTCVTPDTGGKRQKCYPNGTCNEGLSCISGVCVAPGIGGRLEPCYADGTCDDERQCVQGRCADSGRGGPYQACYPNDTCNANLPCVAGICGGTMGGGGAGGSGGTSSGGTSSGGTSSGGTSSGGTGGTTSACQPPGHLCGATCAGNTPETGCFQSKTCAPCSAPTNGSATCGADGQCGFSCAGGFMPSGTQCVPTGAGGSGSGGSSGMACTMCSGICPTAAIDQFCAQQCFQMNCFMCELVATPGQPLPSCKCTCGQ